MAKGKARIARFRLKEARGKPLTLRTETVSGICCRVRLPNKLKPKSHTETAMYRPKVHDGKEFVLTRGELTDASQSAWRSKACREWSADGIVLGSSSRGRPES